MSIHATMAAGKWQELSFAEQMGNIGSEVARARSADARGDRQRRNKSIERALELVDLTLQSEITQSRKRELDLLRNTLAQARDSSSPSCLESVEQYCLPFAVLARKHISQ